MQYLGVLKFLLILSSTSCISGARILAILPLAFKSHHYFHQGVLKALASRGHEVVVYSPFPQTTPIPNYKDVFVNTSYSDDYITYDMLITIFKSWTPIKMPSVWTFTNKFTEESLKNEKIQELARSEEKFDLVFVETFMAQEVMLIFGHIFKAPTIALQPFVPFSLLNKVMGNSLALPYIPEFNFPCSNQMSLYDRLLNSYGVLGNLIFYYTKQIPYQQSLIDRYLNIPGAPSLGDLLKNISMVYTNAHQLISYPQPLTPNIIPLGGIHISQERKRLPKEMQRFIDEAENGFIYLSLGTMVPDHQMPTEFYQQFIRVFKTLKQRVLWKTRRGNITNIPENVMVTKWVPQQDVLAHPNIVLFITHGGLLSLLEVSSAGVPVVGIPFFADQPMNVVSYVARGVGVKLDFLSISERTISTAINTVLSNPRYKENAVKFSKIFENVPMSQQEMAVYWTEHVLTHGGAHHLKPSSANMPWYQLMLLDVLAVILFTLFVIVAVIYILCRVAMAWLTTKPIRPTKSKKQN